MSDPFWFIITALGLLIVPGPTNVVLANVGAARGFRRGLPAVGAVLLGYAITVLLAGLLLAPVVRAHPAVAIALKCVAALYLVSLSVRFWRQPPNAESNVNSAGWRQVFTTTLLNPKGLVFALAIIPFGNPAVAGYLAGFAVVIVLSGSAWLGAGHWIGRLVGARRSLLSRVTSAVLAGFAALIAVTAFG